LLLQETFPSWLYPVTLGATTMWERWNSWSPSNGFVEVGMNSLNHYAYGAVGKWMYSTIAGLDFDSTVPGCQRAIFSPNPGGGLKRASATYQSVYGQFSIKWSIENELLSVQTIVPANAYAELRLPGGSVMQLTAGTHFHSCSSKP
jgi:alpha-L-rhamnosidase